MRIEADTNDHVLKLAASNGNYIALSNDGVEIKGNVKILDDLEVNNVHVKGTLDIDSLVTCKDKLVVQGNIYNKTTNLTNHTHRCFGSVTGSPLSSLSNKEEVK